MLVPLELERWPIAREGAPPLPNFGFHFSAYTLWCRTAKFDVITHMGRGGLSFVGQVSPIQRWRGPSAPQFCFRDQPQSIPKGRSPQRFPILGVSSIHHYTVSRRRPNWAWWYIWGRGLWLGGQPRPPFQGDVALADPNFCGFFATYAYTVRPRKTKFSRAIAFAQMRPAVHQQQLSFLLYHIHHCSWFVWTMLFCIYCLLIWNLSFCR